MPHGPGDPDGALSLRSSSVLTGTANCGTANYLATATALPGRLVRQPAPSPVLLTCLAWNPTAELPARAPAVMAPLLRYRVLRLLVPLNSTSPAQTALSLPRYHSVAAPDTCGPPARPPIPSPSCNCSGFGIPRPCSPANFCTAARQFVSGGYRLTAITRETLTTAPSDVYSGQHRFLRVRERGSRSPCRRRCCRRGGAGGGAPSRFLSAPASRRGLCGSGARDPVGVPDGRPSATREGEARRPFR
ncbi:hypothetical protein ABH937_004305 [Kitasatospora sp. GAS1066B]